MKSQTLVIGARWLSVVAVLVSASIFFKVIAIVYGGTWGPHEIPMIMHWKAIGEFGGIAAAILSFAFGVRGWKFWLIFTVAAIFAYLNFSLQVSAAYKS